jgi:hypothetical protein
MDDVELVEGGSCSECRGKGQGAGEECWWCKGTGLNLSNLGRELLDLLQRIGVQFSHPDRVVADRMADSWTEE